jgi:hypothetical protein
LSARSSLGHRGYGLISGKVSGERSDSGEFEEIYKGDFAGQVLLEPRLHFGNSERVSAEVEEIVVEADTGNAEGLAPGAGDDLLHLAAGFGGAFRNLG